MPRGKFTPFTKAEELKITKEYLKKPVKRLADELGVSFGRIMRFLDNNDLEIPDHVVAARKLIGRRKKGDVPFNKGKKQSSYMTPEAIANSKATRFKKGNKPHNTCKTGNGTLSKRADSSGRLYTYIRLSVSHWELYHRYVWKQHKGKIPEGKIVAFIDDNPDNIVIENLELITRQENMYRNSKHNYPAEVIPSLLLNKQLETKLNTLTNGTK